MHLVYIYAPRYYKYKNEVILADGNIVEFDVPIVTRLQMHFQD